MTQKSIKIIFINKIFSNLPKQNYATNKTDVYYIEIFWKLAILDLKDYRAENNRNYKCFSSNRQILQIWMDNPL